ncbi:Neuronal growth regulator 1 [Bagarius yarrelli]|uniref:Neuronal growth regulator 1 n=1 Tax=Bagarius yarrelli TaxID=175774 RepID=A0A556TR30_BAGYA|nr:Neuronal growth regulator 1 [Bagarius yarrelli]
MTVHTDGILDLWLKRCYLLDGISKGAWLNRSSIIFAGNDKWSVDPRVSIVSNMGDKHEYSLQIQKVDVTDEGFYTCSIQSERNPRPKHIHLIVKVPPKIYDISSDVTVNEGGDVSLFCLATGKPEPKITWRHISPSVPPSIHEMKSHGVQPGYTALLRCEAAAVPSPAFEWYKGEKRLSKAQAGIDIKNLSSRSILTVSNITEDRYGNYTCVAVNKLGAANASVSLIPVCVHFTNTRVYCASDNEALSLMLCACGEIVRRLSGFGKRKKDEMVNSAADEEMD